MAEQYKFWLVWGIGKPAPTLQHPNPLKAEAEANRLALKHPGTKFAVLEAHHVYCTGEPSVEKLNLWLAPDAFESVIEPSPAPAAASPEF